MNNKEDSTENDVTYSNAATDLSITYNDLSNPDRERGRELKFKQLQKKWEMLAEKNSPPETISSKDTFSSRTL